MLVLVGGVFLPKLIFVMMVIVVLLAIAMDPGYKYENCYIIEICVGVLLLPICNPGTGVKPL